MSERTTDIAEIPVVKSCSRAKILIKVMRNCLNLNGIMKGAMQQVTKAMEQNDGIVEGAAMEQVADWRMVSQW